MVKRVLVVLLIVRTTSLECDERLCPSAWVLPKQRGDGFCDYSCNNVHCGFDSGVTDMKLFDFTQSDCYAACSQVLCDYWPFLTFCVNLSNFGNGACLEGANVPECGWDVGMCGYCANNCEL